MLDILLSKLKFLIKSPMVLFVYGIISKWYIMVMVTAVIVAYWVLQGLTNAGILKIAEETVSSALNDTKSVAKNCVPKIMNLGDFWRCLQDPPQYQPTPDETEFEKGARDLLDFEKYKKVKDPDPYSDNNNNL